MKFLIMLIVLFCSTQLYSQDSQKLDKQTIDKLIAYKTISPTITKNNDLESGREKKSFQETFEKESVDTEWALKMKNEFSVIAISNNAFLDMECRTNLCQGSVAFTSNPQIEVTEKNNEFLRVFSKMLHSDIGKSGDLNLIRTKKSTIDNSSSFSFVFGRSPGALNNYVIE